MTVGLRRLQEATRNSQWSEQLWLVGGCVRDELLGVQTGTDYDIVLEGDVIPLANALFEQNLCDHAPVTYPRFGTAMVTILGTQIEFVTARAESYDEDTRKPSVIAATLLQDALRRDFTVNTLLKNLHTGELLDLTRRGLADLERKTLVTPLDPDATFIDDPLRMLRAVRFRHRLGFEPDAAMWASIGAHASRLSIVSAERIQQEWVKMMVGPTPWLAMNDLKDLGLLAQFAPELLEMVGVEQGRYHHLDVWDHSLLVLKNLQNRDLVLALSALFHDIGKPATRSIDEAGNTRFFSHESVGAKMTSKILNRLRFPGELVDSVTSLVRNHMRLGSSPIFTPTAARRVLRDLGDQTDDLLHLVEADCKSLAPGVKCMDIGVIARQIEAVRKATPPAKLCSPLSGAQIMSVLNLEPGPAVGRAKHWLTELVLEGRLAPDDTKSARDLLLLEYLP